jgi:hypothetical protein
LGVLEKVFASGDLNKAGPPMGLLAGGLTELGEEGDGSKIKCAVRLQMKVWKTESKT